MLQKHPGVFHLLSGAHFAKVQGHANSKILVDWAEVTIAAQQGSQGCESKRSLSAQSSNGLPRGPTRTCIFDFLQPSNFVRFTFDGAGIQFFFHKQRFLIPSIEDDVFDHSVDESEGRAGHMLVSKFGFTCELQNRKAGLSNPARIGSHDHCHDDGPTQEGGGTGLRCLSQATHGLVLGGRGDRTE